GRIVRMWGDGTLLGVLGGSANIGGSPLSGAASVAVAPGSGQLLVADTNQNRVLVYARDGTPPARWGAGARSGAVRSGPNGLNPPGAVAAAPDGDVYVADTRNNRVVRLSAAGAFLGAWGRRGGSDGRFRGPAGIAVDAAGVVYVVDSENNRVQTFDAT